MRRTTSLGAVLLVAIGASSTALAQDAIVEGPGHKVGEGTVFHPRAALETGFISNVFYEDQTPVASGVARLVFGFALANEGNKPESVVQDAEANEDATSEQNKTPPKLQFRLSGQIFYEQYLSDRQSVRNVSNLAGTLGGEAIVNPQGNVRFEIAESFTRDTRPRNFESREGMLNRDLNNLILRLVYAPPERAIRLGLRYENHIDVFESSGSAFANRMNHLIGVRAGWQFLPITRFTFDGSFGFFGGLGSDSTKISSNPLRLRLGAASAITEKINMVVHLGFGKGFYAAGPDFTNVVGGVKAGFRYSPMGRFTIGYQYDFRDSLQANFFRDHALIATLDQQLGRLVLKGDAQVRLRAYRGIPMSVGPASRDDLILALNTEGHYLYRDWLAITGKFLAASDVTEYRSTIMNDDPSFSRIEITAGVTAAF